MLTRKQFRDYYAPPKVKQAPKDWGLFVWRGDGCYRREDALAVYRTEKVADRIGTAMNDRGEHGRMVVSRPLDRLEMSPRA